MFLGGWLLGLASTRDLDTQRLLDAVDHISIILGSAIFDIVNSAGLLIYQLGKLSLGDVLGETCGLNLSSAVVVDQLVLNLLVTVSQEVVVGDC